MKLQPTAGAAITHTGRKSTSSPVSAIAPTPRPHATAASAMASVRFTRG